MCAACMLHTCCIRSISQEGAPYVLHIGYVYSTYLPISDAYVLHMCAPYLLYIAEGCSYVLHTCFIHAI